VLAYGNLHTRRLHPMHEVDREHLDEDAQPVADALALLAKLHAGRNHRPVAQTITMLLEAVRAHAGIALWPTGEQALANCSRVVDLARRFEANATSFRAFVERLEADAERGDAGEAPIVEEGTEGVRMMTVHKAKGLEFPVVILADPTCPAAWTKPSRHVIPERRLWLQPLCGCAPIELLEAAAEELQLPAWKIMLAGNLLAARHSRGHRIRPFQCRLLHRSRANRLGVQGFRLKRCRGPLPSVPVVGALALSFTRC
jgi:ATP-dependent helicase/nuclease subunit A